MENQARRREAEDQLNGVSVDGLMECTRKAQVDPDSMEFAFRARNQWLDGSRNQAMVQDYSAGGQETGREKPFVFYADEPPMLLGSDRAANPVEHLLSALSSCLTTSLAYHAAARGITVSSVESEYEGDMNLRGFLGVDPEERKGFREIRVKFKIRSDADDETLMSCMRQSPVYDCLTNPTPVKIIIERV